MEITEERAMDTWQSEQVNELATALVKAQSQMKPAKREATNPFFHSKYADLPTCWEATDSFRANGIAIVQCPMPSDEKTMAIDTVLLHTSGQWMRSRLLMPIAKLDPQGAGSAITYGRRYALGCMTGLVTDEDNDGNMPARKAIPSMAPSELHRRSIENKPENGPVTQLPPAAVAPPQAQDSSGPIIWNAGKTPAQDKERGHRGKDIRDVPGDYLQWYEDNGPQDNHREMARLELDRRDAQAQMEMEDGGANA
jgi:hypothetical protein